MVKNVKKISELDGNTVLIFSLKNFLATLGTILGIFFGFYEMVVTPKIDATERHYAVMYESQTAQNTLFFQKLNDIDKSITSLNVAVEELRSEQKYIKKLSYQAPILPPLKPDSISSKETYAYQDFFTDKIIAYICRKEDED